MLSILTGEPIEAPLSEPNKLRKTASGSLVAHLLFFVFLVVLPYLSSMIWPTPPDLARSYDPPSLVFLVEEGPGGGGGGSSDDSEDPASVLKIEGEDQAQVAIDVEDDSLVFDDPDEPNEPEEEEEEETKVAAVDAPVVEMSPDDFDQVGVLDNGLEQAMAAAGNGEGTGIGDGRGSGIGDGTGGGFGGGAYRIGSGITPPELRRRVDPKYTSDALSRKLQGVVVLEVVILAEGRIRDARILQSLDDELDQKAIEAVRQWVFLPGKLKGKPVAVYAEIEVVFSLL